MVLTFQKKQPSHLCYIFQVVDSIRLQCPNLALPCAFCVQFLLVTRHRAPVIARLRLGDLRHHIRDLPTHRLPFPFGEIEWG